MLLVSRVSNFSTFRPTTSHFQFTATSRQVHQMTPKWPWTLQGQRYPIYVLLVSLSSKVQSSKITQFGGIGHFETNAPNDREMALKQFQGHFASDLVVRGTPYMCYWCSWVPYFSPFPLQASVFGLQTIWDNWTEWPQFDVVHYKVKGTPYMSY